MLIRRWRTAFGFFLLFVVWELGVHLFGVKQYILPPPTDVLRALVKNWHPVLVSAGTTSLEIVAGYALAIAVSIPLAIGIVFSRAMEETVYPVVVFLQIVPKIAVAPLFIIWFGADALGRIAAGRPALATIADFACATKLVDEVYS
jgi:NitT/TauT family transport system permease protein